MIHLFIYLFPLHKIIRWYSNCFKIACFSSYRAVWSVKCVWPTSFVTHECSRHHITISSSVDKFHERSLCLNFTEAWCLGPRGAASRRLFVGGFFGRGVKILIWFHFSNISAISWRPVLVVEEAGVPGEKHQQWASNW